MSLACKVVDLITSYVRTGLRQFVAPPGRANNQLDPLTLCHLAAAFPLVYCPIAAFQSGLQAPITGPFPAQRHGIPATGC